MICFKKYVTHLTFFNFFPGESTIAIAITNNKSFNLNITIIASYNNILCLKCFILLSFTFDLLLPEQLKIPRKGQAKQLSVPMPIK